MSFFKTTQKFHVKSGNNGILLVNNKNKDFYKMIPSGMTEISDTRKNLKLYIVPQVNSAIDVPGQEVVLDDGTISHLYYKFQYKIIDFEKILTKFDITDNDVNFSSEIVNHILVTAKIISAKVLSENKGSENLFDILTKEVNEELEPIGLSVIMTPNITKYHVANGNIAFVFRNYKLLTVYKEGIYELENSQGDLIFVILPLLEQSRTVSNQEVLTKDGIALRFSYFYFYKITEPELVMKYFNISFGTAGILTEIENRIHAYSQIAFRDIITSLNAEDLNENKSIAFTDIADKINVKAKEFGVEVLTAPIRDITFPKSIQDIMAVGLESKIKAKSELESARTSVAVARAMKNAADLLKDDENMKLIKYMEHMERLAKSGNVNFYVGLEDKVKLNREI